MEGHISWRNQDRWTDRCVPPRTNADFRRVPPPEDSSRRPRTTTAPGAPTPSAHATSSFASPQRWPATPPRDILRGAPRPLEALAASRPVAHTGFFAGGGIRDSAMGRGGAGAGAPGQRSSRLGPSRRSAREGEAATVQLRVGGANFRRWWGAFSRCRATALCTVEPSPGFSLPGAVPLPLS